MSLLRSTIVASLVAACFLFKSCGSLQPSPTADASGAIQELEALLASVNLESAAWRNQVDAAVQRIAEEGHQAIANDLAAVVGGAIQATGQEVRCTTDFLRDRVKQDIEGLIARLQGEDPPQPEPSVCTILPPTIDLNFAPNRLRPSVISGYDLKDRDSHAQVTLQAVLGNGQRQSAARLLTLTSPYAGVINVSQENGCWLITNNIRKLRLLDGDQELSSIAVNMPGLVAESHTGSTSNFEFLPARTDGDKDFGTNPIDKVVRVNLKTTARIKNNKVVAQVFMDAREWNKNSNQSAGDGSRAKGTSGEQVIYTAPANRRISRVVTAVVDNPVTYNQEGWDARTLSGASDLVERYVVTTDGAGDDIGTRTKVKVFFEPVIVQLEPVNPWCR